MALGIPVLTILIVRVYLGAGRLGLSCHDIPRDKGPSRPPILKDLRGDLRLPALRVVGIMGEVIGNTRWHF